MNRKIKAYSMVFMLLAGIAVLPLLTIKPKTKGPEVSRPVPVHPCRFYDERDFFKSISLANSAPPSDFIRGGVVPHHLLAGYMIADFFHILSLQDINRVIILGPNHYNKGPRIATSRYSWETAFGILEVDGEFVGKLIQRGIAQTSEEFMPEEHSIAGLIPYIKFYLPEVKIVPLIFHSDITEGEARNLGEFLGKNLNEKDVIVASVDFSHYLPISAAQEKDEETIKAIKEFNISALFKMGNDHLDSPASIGTLLQAMKHLDAEELVILHHSNSGIILGRGVPETTSYFTIVFY